MEATPPVFFLKTPLPKFGAEMALKNELIRYLQTSGLTVGSPFLSDREVVEATQKSRTFVRRSLKLMQKEGWIKRICGVGTFVGQRAAGQQNFEITEQVKPMSASSQAIRIAAMTVHPEYSNTWSQRGWCMEVLDGFNEANDRHSVILEYYGNQVAEPGRLAHRLTRNSPDLVICLGPAHNHIVAIAESIRLGIPCILAGVRCPEFHLPNIYDDGSAACAEAVRHLANLGHQRIGFVQIAAASGYWAFDRFFGYGKGLDAAGLKRNNNLAFWIEFNDSCSNSQKNYATTEREFEAYLEREKPTALIFGCSKSTFPMDPLIRSGKIKIPDDLSVIVFDQDPFLYRQLGGIEPTTIRLPLRNMGRELCSMSQKIISGDDIISQVLVPCELALGQSATPPRTDASKSP